MKTECCYVSCNSNPTPTAADWGKNSLICYGSCNSVRIWDPNYGAGGKVIRTFIKHTKRVNSVRWIRGCDSETELVSGSSDGNVVVWNLRDAVKPIVLTGHNGNVNIVDGLYDRTLTIIVSASVDSTVKIWNRLDKSGDFDILQSINLGYGLCVALRLCYIAWSNSAVLAAALDDSSIKLFVKGSAHEDFVQTAVLKGHEDWVRGLDFFIDSANNEILLASASQDTFIRLWRISADLQELSFSLESVLAGHEGWIYSVNWNPNSLQLLSASLDKTMIIWEFDPQIGLWFEKVRVGEVGGNTLGFYGGVFGPSGGSILAHSYHGAFHLWNFVEDVWMPSVTVGGHFGEVVDLAWDPEGGAFVISVSEDQTTRVHAPWSKNHSEKVTWHEIARPQIHGYDMSSLAVIARYKFASGAEEKVIRSFEAPANFIDNFKRICGCNDSVADIKASSNAKGASVPSLGLSNKAVFTGNSNENSRSKSNDPYPEESHFTAVELNEPPTEETLLQNTLWPEVQKLYGHGYEIYSLAASPDGKLIASACKATTVEHAAILLWETTTWNQIQKLHSHNLTVAQMCFSPDSQNLLSVSRDRRWSLFSRNQDTNEFALYATVDKKTSIHTRIIWCCAWTHDGQYFMTGSRDGKVVVWRKREEWVENVAERCKAASEPLELKGESITAVAFAPSLVADKYLAAVGLEAGLVLFYTWNNGGFKRISVLDQSSSHHLTVKRLSFRPNVGVAGSEDVSENVLQLASCSSDYSVRIYNLYIHELLNT